MAFSKLEIASSFFPSPSKLIPMLYQLTASSMSPRESGSVTADCTSSAARIRASAKSSWFDSSGEDSV